MDFEKLHNAQYNIIDVAEPRSLSLLGMVHATCTATQMVSLHLYCQSNSSSWQAMSHMRMSPIHMVVPTGCESASDSIIRERDCSRTTAAT